MGRGLPRHGPRTSRARARDRLDQERELLPNHGRRLLPWHGGEGEAGTAQSRSDALGDAPGLGATPSEKGGEGRRPYPAALVALTTSARTTVSSRTTGLPRVGQGWRVAWARP